MFKKIISVLLCAVLIFSALSITVFAENQNDEIRFAVASDLHTRTEKKLVVYQPESELFFHGRNSGNLYNEAIGILKTFLAQSVSEGADFILIPGDLTDSSTKDQHKAVASVFAEFEKNTGIPVYITPGNHDYAASAVEDIKKLYSPFGFDEAINTDEKTASYTADLPGNYRLISVDSNNPGKDGDGITEELLTWIEEQTEQAKQDGKPVFLMMHHALLDPIPYAGILMKNFIVRDHLKIAERFASAGIQFVFTGHEHGNNVTSYTAKNGNIIYDILTTSLTSYPLEYRFITCTDSEMKVECHAVTTCNNDELIEGYTEKQLELMNADYTQWSLDYFKFSIEKKIAKYISSEFLKSKLKSDNKVLNKAVDTVMPVVENALEMPFYGKGETVEQYAKKSGITLPKSDYANLYDLVTSLVAMIYRGGENCAVETSPEGKLLVTALNVMLKYVLAQAGNESCKLVLETVIGETKTEEIFRPIFSSTLYVPCADTAVYPTAVAVLTPVLNKFLVDDEIPDRDVTLKIQKPAGTVEGFAGFFRKIQLFFTYIIRLMKTVF